MDLHTLLEELVKQPHEQQWLEFKLSKGSINNDTIGEYISAMSNGATIANKSFGYLATVAPLLMAEMYSPIVSLLILPLLSLNSSHCCS